MNTKYGVLYITTGLAYTKMALHSASSVKDHNPNLPIFLFTDQKELDLSGVDGFDYIKEPHVRSKLDYLNSTPFDETLFLDADTKVVCQIESLFTLLERFEIALAQAPKRNDFKTLQTWNINLPYSFPQLNTGVILYKSNDGVRQLLNDWKEAYHANAFSKDQVTLRELLWKSPLKLGILPPEFNIRYSKYLDVWEEKEAHPKILHLGELKKQFNADTDKSKPKSLNISQKLELKYRKLRWLWWQLKSM